ncbi:hypothetical protein OF83DRAFT_174914 [Amylostereum chailletii]|nr:hypothetical protein OF83DRAFT_174914 [Amylostereum chailletii]
MPSIEFEPALKEVVNAKRISASRMKDVTDMGLGLMQHDTQLVSVLYRTHKSCKSQPKIHSLYVVDSLARAARRYADKHGQTGDANASPGTCATFMLKLENVLDGFFQEMTAPNVPEGKEKSKKILDIWTKNRTFPAGVVKRLLSVVAGDPGAYHVSICLSLSTSLRAIPPMFFPSIHPLAFVRGK